MVFEGGILSSAWGNPYLNSTTVLFDKVQLAQGAMEQINHCKVENFYEAKNLTNCKRLSRNYNALYAEAK